MDRDITILRLSALDVGPVSDFWGALTFPVERADSGELIVAVTSSTLAVYVPSLDALTTSFVTVISSRTVDPDATAVATIEQSGGSVRRVEGVVELRDPTGNVWHLTPESHLA